MGCLGTIIGSIFSFFYYIVVVSIRIIGFLALFLIAGIISLTKHIIKSRKEKKNNNYNKQNYYQNISSKTKNIDSKKENNLESKINNTKNITNSYSYLKIYINKKYKGLHKNDELNYDLLNIKSYDVPTVYYDEFAEIKDYNVFEADECSSEKYGALLQKIHNHCGNDFYATIGYESNKIEYRITIKDNNIYINGNNIQYMKNRYNTLKNKIITFSDNLYERLTYIKDDRYYIDVVPNDELDCDSIESLANKLNNSNETLMFEIPYMEEISYIIDIIEPKIIEDSNKGIEKVMKSLPDIEVLEENEYYEECNEPIINKPKPKENSWREKEFDKEAELWGLSEEDKRIAKEEGMTPAEFIEAEEYDDDELLLDEWER